MSNWQCPCGLGSAERTQEEIVLVHAFYCMKNTDQKDFEKKEAYLIHISQLPSVTEGNQGGNS